MSQFGWWRSLPKVQHSTPSDVCHHCGHVRSLHPGGTGLVAGDVWKCVATRCVCHGNAATEFYHIAGYDGTRDTVTLAGRTVQIAQPRRPGEPLV